MIQTASLFLVASLLATGPAGTIARSSERDTKPIGEKQITRIIAAARAAMGYPHKYLAMTRRGTFVRDGGAPNVFDTTVDLRNGFSRTRWATGPATFTSGYDGAAWDASDGTLTIVSLPSLVADAVTEAYLNSIAFLGSDQRSNIVSGRAQRIRGNLAYILEVVPRGGSPAELYFDAVTSRLTKVVEHKATGIESITYDDFRTVQGVEVAPVFRAADSPFLSDEPAS